jgi:soluble lytic murein transglycosylase
MRVDAQVADSFIGSAGLLATIRMVAGGAQIVSQINWPVNYDDKDLYRPDVSITLGAYYLGKNRSLLDGDLYAALAAYNGGPGNSLEWRRLAGGDPDLFLESVRFEETRNYIRAIYEIFGTYRTIYSPVQ